MSVPGARKSLTSDAWLFPIYVARSSVSTLSPSCGTYSFMSQTISVQRIRNVAEFPTSFCRSRKTSINYTFTCALARTINTIIVTITREVKWTCKTRAVAIIASSQLARISVLLDEKYSEVNVTMAWKVFNVENIVVGIFPEITYTRARIMWNRQ